ncbi:helix-turn-helix transcriptional regulator [Nocardia sp. NPDC050793]|uniref:helix-turn-helix transcriptional regulator n=1 Tax=Nocardia sp. NPDC050793 TaxID=3155159 RepID=UPI003407B144
MAVSSETVPWLTNRDLDAVLRVIEECECAPSLADFRDIALESLARFLGYRHSTFFIAPSEQQLFEDRTPKAHGLPTRLLTPYIEDFHSGDVFSQPAVLRTLQSRRVLTLDDLSKPVTPLRERYLDEFLFRNGAYAKMVVLLKSPSGYAAAVGLIDGESGRFGPHDVATFHILARHLGNLLNNHLPKLPGTAGEGDLQLSVRQTEVARLVAMGLTNQEVATAMQVTTATVKKHLTHAMRVLGCTNRTQLAMRYYGSDAPQIDSPVPQSQSAQP